MASFPYDIKLTVTGGSAYGFMIASPAGESKSLQIDEARPPGADGRIPDGETATNTVFGDLNDIAFAQSDLAGGVGELEMDATGDTSRYWWGSGVVTHVSGKTYLAPPVSTESVTSESVPFVNFRTFLHSSGTRYDITWQNDSIYVRDASNGTNNWTKYTPGGADDEIQDVFIFNGTIFLAIPEVNGSVDYRYITDITDVNNTWNSITTATAFSDALGKPKYFSSVRGYMFAAVDNQKVFYTATPLDGTSWIGPIDTSLEGNISGPPGDTTYGFQGMVAVNDFLFPLKKDAIYNIDANQEVTEAVWQWKARPSANNFKYHCTGGIWLYYSVSPEVYAYDPTTGRNVPLGLANMSGFSVEEINGLAADNQYLYVLAQVRVPTIRSSSSEVLLRGVQVGAARWAFEVLWEDTASTAYSALAAFPQADTSATRVYWGKDDGSATVHMDIPANWDETTSGSYATSGTLYTSIWRTGFENFIKRWLWVATYTEALSASSTIVISYSIDGGTTFTALGTLDTDDAGLDFNNFSNITAEHIVLRFVFASAGSATPVLRTYSLHARPRWRYLPVIAAPVRVADYIELLNGAADERLATTLVSQIETLRTSNAEITYEDYLGHSFVVSIDSIQFRPSRHEDADDGKAKNEMTAVMMMTRADSGS